MAQTGTPEPSDIMRADNLRGAGFMLIAMASFATGDACMKLVSETMPLYQAVALRGIITIPLLMVIGHMTGGLHFARVARSWRIVSLRSLGEVAATLTFFVALMNLPLPINSAIQQSAPLVVTAGAALFMGEKVGWRRAMAILLGLVGVLIIVRPGPEGINIYALVSLASVGFVAFRDLLTRKLPRDVPSVTVALAAAITISLTALVITPPSQWQPVPLGNLPLILVAAFCVITGYIFVIRVMRVGEVGFTTPFRYSALIWAMVYGWLIWGFFPDGLTLVGAGIVVASGLFTLLREAKLGGKRRAAPIHLQR